MSGAILSLTTPGLDEAIKRLSVLPGFEMAELADDAAAILESSTRARFETKEAPDGTPWADWSDDYAATRGSNHSLLINEGEMRDSIASYATGDEAAVGSNLVYFAHQHFGGEEIDSGIPARPVLGMSDQDEQDIYDLATGRLEELLQ
ncbi:phage virion morphogenesis protein [Aliiroseovarius lamellibrachiae]|uniref:phage virion morphogenesis protein n=1 Tax=Aliiroseovarius lamellibrachiae TaxID=1924933 RepID=UPI001BDF9AB9|nr:phage virion morphogenesis protein [Aliiroseovarius lamellibrachiae]MBT2131222.1 phage virion morphogenesis protein [Aliiroseovarius lamellibrachiae]